jgi:hypothetical protein
VDKFADFWIEFGAEDPVALVYPMMPLLRFAQQTVQLFPYPFDGNEPLFSAPDA